MRVLATDVVLAPGLVDLPTVLRSSDVVTLHAPLTDDTRNLIGAEQLAMMRRNAILINTARAVSPMKVRWRRRFKNGVIGGAGFDVLTNEPPTAGNVLLDLDLPNFIVTPHIAWASQEAMQILADQLIDNVEAFVTGEPRNVV